jgi:hypothetical protein
VNYCIAVCDRDTVLSAMSKVTEELIALAAQHRRERKLVESGREWAEAVELSRQEDDTLTLIRALRGVAETDRSSV